MAVPDFVLALRDRVGTMPLWLSGVTAVVVRDADALGDGGVVPEILVVRRSDNGAWTPVTGIVDPGEHPGAAAAREVLEEADVVAVPIRLSMLGVTGEVVYPNGDRAQYIDHTFLCRYVSGEPNPADGENTEARWVRADELPPMSDEMLGRIDSALNGGPEARFSV